jgi:hypothetical protein
MSEFDQEDGHKKWFANPDFNPVQCNVVAAEHRENRTTAERHTGDYDCLGQLIDPKSRWPDFDCARQHNVRPPSYDKKIGLVPAGRRRAWQLSGWRRLASARRIFAIPAARMFCSNAFRDRLNVRHAINELYKLLPPELASTEQAKRLYEYGCVTEMDIIRLIYRPVEPQGASKTYDFSRAVMEKRWQQGASDARTVLHTSPWLAPAPKELGVRVFDVPREDSHRRIDNLPTRAESHVGIDVQPLRGRRSQIRENLVNGRS